jgi:hypothetical protein
MATRHEIIRNIPLRLANLGATGATLSALAGVSAGVLSRLLSGQQQPTDWQVRVLDDAVTRLESLQRVTIPLPLDYSQTAALKDCLQKLEDNCLQIIVSN